MFSNEYIFIRKNNIDNFGIFIQHSSTDDSQYWYGHGSFTETNKKIVLTFDTTSNHNRVKLIPSAGHSDTLCIKRFDWWGDQQTWFNVWIEDITKSKKKYDVDYRSGVVKIPKEKLTSINLSLCAFSSNRSIFDLFVTDNIRGLDIFVNDPLFMHTFDKGKEKLKKNAKGFTTVGMWTKEKPTQFGILKK